MLPLFWFCFLCIFAGKMLTLPNKSLCSRNLCCLTFDSPLLSVSATFAGQTKGPRKSLQPCWLGRGCGRHSTRLQADGSPFPGAELWKRKQLVVPLGSPQPPRLLNCQPLSKHSFPAWVPTPCGEWGRWEERGPRTSAELRDLGREDGGKSAALMSTF